MANEEKTWQPTPNGAFVLFGVAGYPDGYGVQPAPDRRDAFYKVFNANCVGKQSVGGWLYPEYPEAKRGTWSVERLDEKTVRMTLKLGNKVIWEGKVQGSNEVPEDRPDPFGG